MKRHTLRLLTPPRTDTEEQILVVPFGELAYAPAVQLCMTRRPMSFSRITQTEVCRGSTGSCPNLQTTS